LSKERVYEYLKKERERIQVHKVMRQCGLSRAEAIEILEELKSKGYIAGNAREGYWLTREGWLKIKS
jgi:predicted transcriptional regulator